ncbi:MAG: extracellular solute-binding protein [Sphaerochaetaceae bacterium]|jgi:putative aldouronate transport system substrate-binding protein
MKRLSVLCILLCSASLMLMAQGGGEQPGQTSQKADAPTSITFWYNPAIVEAGSPPKDWFVYDRIRDELGIDLQLSPLPSNANDRDTKATTAGAANNLPDMLWVRRPVMLNLVKQGLLAPVDDLYALMPDRTEKMYPAGSIAYTSTNGHSYGFAPSTGDIKKNEGILIRKDWLDNLGLDIPVTLEDYLEVMKAFTFQDPDGNGKNDTYGYGTFIEITAYEEGLGRRLDPFFGSFGVAGTWDLSKAHPGLNVRKPEYYQAMQYIKLMLDEGVMDPNWLAYKKDDWKAAWKQGKFGIMREQNASYSAESNYSSFDKNFPNGEWIVIAPPVGPEGKSAVGVYTDVNDGIIVVSQRAMKDGKGPLIAKLLEWMSKDGYYAIGWGEEGVNFVFDKNGIPTVTGLADPSKGFTKSEVQPLLQLKGLAFYWGEAELASRYPTYVTAVSKKTMSALATLREMQAQPWIKQSGIDLLPLPGSDLKRFYEQTLIEFVRGSKPLTEAAWNKFVSDFDAMGGKAWEEAGIKTATELGLLY